MVPPASTKAFSSRSVSPRAREAEHGNALAMLSHPAVLLFIHFDQILLPGAHKHPDLSPHMVTRPMSRSCHRNPYRLVNPGPNQNAMLRRVGSSRIPIARFFAVPCQTDRDGTFENSGPSPSAIVRCVMTASRSFG